MKCFLKETEYGKFEVITPIQLVVDEELEWTIVYTAGENVIKKGGSIKIIVPAYQHQRSEEYLQDYDYWKPNYIYAIGENCNIKVDTKIEKIPTSFSHIKKWPDSNRIAIITLQSDLKQGEKIYIHFGGINRPWLEGDVPPTRVSQIAFKKEGTYLKYGVLVDADGLGDYEEVEVFPSIKVVPEKPHKVTLIAPSIVNELEEFNIGLLVSDRFNNPIFDYEINNFIIQIKDLKEDLLVGEIKNDGRGYLYKIKKEGFYEVTVKNIEGINVEKAVIMCKNSEYKLYWGDIHNHSSLTANVRDNNGGASPAVGYTYAKEVSKLDYVCISEQTFEFNENIAVNVNKETWDTMGKEADNFYKKGELVTFPGCELHSKRGDTVILFAKSLSSYPYPTEDVKEICDIWEYYKDKELLTIPHLHRYCNGRPFKDQQEKKYEGFNLENWEANNDKERLVEVFSSQWGRFEFKDNAMVLKARNNVKDNTVVDFLNRGKKWGITASSDGHDGKAGYGGITGVYAKDKTREAIFDGLKERRTIATTHSRIIVDFSINEKEQGSINKISQENIKKGVISVNVVAPKKIKEIVIIKNGEILEKTIINNQWAEIILEDIMCFKKDTYYYARVLQEDGHIAWSSPIWFENDVNQ